MSKLIPSREKADLVKGAEEPNPMWALAVGLVYVFRTGPGSRILRELETAVRQYAADPAALWRLVRHGEEVIDTTASETPDEALDSGAKHRLSEGASASRRRTTK